jgi:hypothetical protein
VEKKVEHQVVEAGRRIKEEGEKLVQRVETAKENHVSSVPLGSVVGDLNGETFTGGPGPLVRAKRASEGSTQRLV